jgi:hypothetical protein
VSLRFARWTNALPTLFAGGAFFGLVGVVWGTWYWATPDFFEVGYMPRQPGSGFSHQIHAGKLGLDCRYCHTKVEKSAEANVPNVATCMGCHGPGRVSDEFARPQMVQFVRDAYDENRSIPWRRVHKLPDYVRNFPHDLHVHAGVSCYSCHGQITAMPDVYQAHGLGMGWCLDCHRNAEPTLVEPSMVTRLVEVEHEMARRERGEGAMDGAELFRRLRLQPPQNCGACHY